MALTAAHHHLHLSQNLSLYKRGTISISAALTHLNVGPTTTAQPSEYLLYSRLLQALPAPPSHPSSGLIIHCHVIKSGLLSWPLVAESLVLFNHRLYPLQPIITRRLFDELCPLCSVLSWTSMLSCYLHASQPEEGLKLFAAMPRYEIEPNAFTLSAAAKACSALAAPAIGGSVHAVVLKYGHFRNFVVSSALLDMYGRCRLVDDARKVFEEMPQRDSVCWTSIISALTSNGKYQDALDHFVLMLKIKPRLALDGRTFASVMTSLGNLGRLKQGREFHVMAIFSGICCSNVIVESSIVDMYAKCGAMDDSRRTFDNMSVKNGVSWSALFGGYCHLGFYGTVLTLFRGMDAGVVDVHILGMVIRACSGLAAIKPGKEVHSRVFRTTSGLHHVVVDSALIDFYSKCGLIEYASRVFARMPVKNTITWNSMICGFAQNGLGGEAIKLFKRMSEEGAAPDYITFVGVLSACSHTGMVEQGKKFFKLMEKMYGILPHLEHYSCMVDLLGRVGLLIEAENFINESYFKNNSSLWAALLGACVTHLDPDIAERIATKIMFLNPKCDLSYVLLANIYKRVGRWKEAAEIRKVMRDRIVMKTAGTSSVGVEQPKGFSTSYKDEEYGFGTSSMEKAPSNCVVIC